MAITGVHTLINTPEPQALRATLRDVFGWRAVHAHPEATDERLATWLIFELPPAELAVHPADDTTHTISFMCDDIEATVSELAAKGIEFVGGIEDQGFGLVTTMRLPGRVEVMLYEPQHVTAI